MHRKHTWFYRLISTVLSLILALQMLPAGAFAVTVSDSETVAVPEEAAASPVTVIGEDVSKRTETGKHFRLSDGIFIAVNYGVAVHYMDDNNAWQEIDNRPSPTATRNSHYVEYSRTADGYIGRNTGGGTVSFAFPSEFAYRYRRFYALGIYIYE